MEKLPIYRIFIDESEGALVYRNSIVTDPAHGKKQYSFDKVTKKIDFSDVKQNIVGVAISPDMPIYRNDVEIGEHYVVFKKQDIEAMAYNYSKNKFHNELDFEHDNNDRSKSSVCYFSFIVDREKGFNPPEAFKDEPDGTWLLGYHFFDKKEYEKAKSKGGFSIEGTFLLERISNNFKNNNMKKDEKEASAFSKIIKFIGELGATEEATEETTFEDVTLEDGTVAKHEGVGTALMFITEDGEIVAEDGSYKTESGMTIIVVDGLISEITEEAVEEVAAVSDEVSEFAAAAQTAFEKLFKQNEEMAKRIEAIEKKPVEAPKQKFERNDGLSSTTQKIMNQIKKN